MNKKWVSRFMAPAAAALILAGCNFSGGDESGGSSEGESGAEGDGSAAQTIVLSEQSDIPTMDSTKAHDSIAFNVLNNINEGLYRQNESNDVELAMAEKHDKNEDETVHTFTLREQNWSNGEPVTANDFEYAWKRVMREAGPYNYMLVTAGIKNAEAIMNEEKDADELGVKAIDEKTLEVTLEAPNPLFETLLAFATFLPQNQAFVEEQGDQYALEAENVLANGPFVFSEWQQEQGWTLEKNEDYWDAENVKLDKAEFVVVKDPQSGANLYETEKVDRVKLTSSLVDQYQDNDGFTNEKASGIVFLRFNHNHEVLSNANIRRAVNMAIDRDGLTDVILKDGSTPLYGVVPGGFYTSPEGEDYRELNGDINKGTPEEAQEFWKKGLEETGVDSLTVSLNIADTDEMKKVGEYLQAQLEDNLPGFKLELKAVPFAQRLEIEKAIEYDLSLSTWGPDYADPMTYLDMWVDGSSANRMDYSNPKLDELVAEARTDTDLSNRYKTLLEIEKVLLEEDAAVAPLYQRGNTYLTRPSIENLVIHPAGADLSLKWASVK